MRRQPSGTVTFLFTDIEGSTRLLEALGRERYAAALDLHRSLLREAFDQRGGYEVDCEGDSFFVAFQSAADAVAAAAAAQQALAAADWPEGRELLVRMGLHTGEPLLAPPKYVGLDVHRAARIMACGHGGQVVLSPATVGLLEPGAFELHDLGRHRLKDLSDPIALQQLLIDGLPQEFPALKTLDRSNLPTPATPFLGRDDELREVTARLADPATRVLTLTGPGGTGKTRLALQAAAEASDSFPDGVFWVALAPLQDPGLVLSSVAHALGVKEQPGVMWSETLAESQAGRRFAILLDNVEHLLPAAATRVAELAAACPTATVLATSRERLQIATETTWPVPPLSASDGERLFVERARGGGIELEVDEAVSELCRRLDELPLAIELAAARTVVLTPAQLLQRLSQRLDLLRGARDADPRQQTLRATIDWSYRLLEPEEQRVYRALAVFAGGCTLEATEEVAAADLDVVQSLLDKSFLRQRDASGTRRYWMLETIREFALERLAEAGEERAVRDAHAAWLERFVADGAPEYFGIGAAGWLERVETEVDNLRAALVDSRATDPARLARIVGSVFNHWYFSSRLTEGRDWLVVAADGAPNDIALIRGLSNLSVRLGDTEGARTYAEREIELARALGSAGDLAEGLRDLGNAHSWAGDLREAKAAYEASADAGRAAGSEMAVGAALGNLAGIAMQEGRWEDGLRMSHDFQLIAERCDDDYGRVIAVFNQGLSHMGAGRPDEAEPFLLEALRVGVEWDFPEGIIFPLEGLGMVAAARGEHERVALVAGVCEAARREIALGREEPEDEMFARAVEAALAALGAERFETLAAEGRSHPLADAGREELERAAAAT